MMSETKELADIGTITLDQINLNDINLDEVKYDLNQNQVSLLLNYLGNFYES